MPEQWVLLWEEVTMLRNVLLSAVVVAVLSLSATANAKIWHVHPDSAISSIQAGIDSSYNGDTVLVYPETYYENINFNMKNIVVGSLFLTTGDTSYSASTIIDGYRWGSVVTFENGEDSTAVITGFTIQNGHAEWGGGIHCSSSSPILANIAISGNTAEGGISRGGGGGIYCHSSSPSLTNVTISENNGDYGGGIYCWDNSSPSLINVTISQNTAQFDGGGIYCDSSSPSLTNVIISGNDGEGICCSDNSSPSLSNVTISGNDGSGIFCWDSSPSLSNVTISGTTGFGIQCFHSSPSLTNVTISENNSGGIFCEYSFPSLINVTISGNTGGGICCVESSNLTFDAVNRCNIFLNFAASGCDLYASDCPTIDVIVDTFTVLEPDDHFAHPIDNFTFDILNAKVEQVNQDLYVNPDGSDDNSGLTVDDPLLTVSYALAKILADSTNPLTIHLSNGIYSPSETGERFPLNCRSYVSLLGEDEASTILDGEGLSRLLWCGNDNNFSIENMTIQNGWAGYEGGGIYCYYSSPSIENVTISGNTADYWGGGVYCGYSSPSLTNVIISENTAGGGLGGGDGGGIFCWGGPVRV